LLLPADADLVAREPELPGMALLLDPEAFVAELGMATGARVTGAHITYIKYKPGVRCLIGYCLNVGSDQIQAYAIAYRGDAVRKLQQARDAAAVPGPLGAGHIVLAETAVVIRTFPNDRELQALPCLANAARRESLLRDLLPEQSELWNGLLVGLRYKPERRYVAQLRGTDGLRSVLRVYAKPGYPAACRNAWTLASSGLLRLPRLLGHVEERCLLALEWLPGRRLSDVLHTSSDGNVAAVGAALAAFHSQPASALTCRTHEVETAALRAAANGVAFVCPHLAGRAASVAERLAVGLAQHGSCDTALHGDFYADQVLIDGDTVAIVDLDEAARGDPAVDLGNFVAHLREAVRQRTLAANRAQRLRGSLLQGYQAATGGALPSTLDLQTAAALFRLAPHPFRRREVDWPVQTEAILQDVEAILNGGWA
jgi:tRNA A-37 threonylcarbamoyl transferase component Bud32